MSIIERGPDRITHSLSVYTQISNVTTGIAWLFVQPDRVFGAERVVRMRTRQMNDAKDNFKLYMRDGCRQQLRLLFKGYESHPGLGEVKGAFEELQALCNDFRLLEWKNQALRRLDAMGEELALLKVKSQADDEREARYQSGG
jgi:hypothetical protein